MHLRNLKPGEGSRTVHHETQDATLGGETLDEWRLFTLRILMHETGHARYEEAKPGKPRPARAISMTFA